MWTWLPIDATTRPSLRDCVSSCVVTYVDASVENSRCYCDHLTHCCLMCAIKKREGSYSAAIRVKYCRTGGRNKLRNELEESIRWSICQIKPDLTTGFKGFKAAEGNVVHVLHSCFIPWKKKKARNRVPACADSFVFMVGCILKHFSKPKRFASLPEWLPKLTDQSGCFVMDGLKGCWLSPLHPVSLRPHALFLSLSKFLF